MKLTSQQKGVGFAILAPLLYSLKSIAVKSAPPAKIEFFVFSRFLFDLLLLAPLLIKNRVSLPSRQIPFHFLRGILAMIAIYCSVYAVRNLALVDVILLENTVPLFIPLIVWVFLGEKIAGKSWVILLLGFSSLLFLLNPTFDLIHLGSLAAMGAAFASGGSAVTVNVLAKKDSAIAILFYFNAFGCCLSFFPLLYTWEGMPTLSFFYPFLIISLFGVAAQYAMTRAYSLIQPHLAGSFFYLSVLFSALLGWVGWNEPITLAQGLGGTLLIGSSLLMLRVSRQKASKISVPSHKFVE